MIQAEPSIARPLAANSAGTAPAAPRKTIGQAPLPGTQDARYVPKRGLVRSLRNAQAGDAIKALANRHKLDPESRDRLGAELIKAGAPPITLAAAEAALSRLVHFEPLNADALRPFLILSADRSVRAWALGRIADAMRSAGRSVRILSDAIDVEENETLLDAGKRLGCGVTRYDGSPNCVDILRKTDLACLSLVEAGFRAPLDRVAMLRLSTLIQATGSEPVFVMRAGDGKLAVQLSQIGVKRVILAETHEPTCLGPVLSAMRKGNLALAEMLDMRSVTAPLRAATPRELAAILTDAKAVA